MPKVAGRHFSYSRKGRAAASKLARKLGKKMIYKKAKKK